MIKRIATLVLVGLLVLSTNAFAQKGHDDFAIGAQVTSSNFSGAGGMLTLHIPGVPMFFAFGANSGPEMQLAMTADYWLHHAQIAGILHSYLGLGVYGAITPSNTTQSLAGVRMPVALQIWPLDSELLEVFLEIAPAWLPITGTGIDANNFQAQLAVGFRFWP
ncbi:hypothetical protein [Spirochaeta dissipatitropha]